MFLLTWLRGIEFCQIKILVIRKGEWILGRKLASQSHLCISFSIYLKLFNLNGGASSMVSVFLKLLLIPALRPPSLLLFTGLYPFGGGGSNYSKDNFQTPK